MGGRLQYGQYYVWLLALSFGVCSSRAGERVFLLRDHLNREWTHEFVTYRVTFKQNVCVAASFCLTGPDGEIPVQVSPVTRWNGGFLREADVSFVVAKLERLGQVRYVLTYASKARPAPAPAAVTDLRVTTRSTAVELTTSHFGVRLPTGAQTFAPPAAGAGVPGPILGLRTGDGTWFGGSRLYGPAMVTAMRSEVLAAGPVFAAVRVVYHYANDNEQAVTVRLVAGDYAARVVATVNRAEADSGWEALLTRGLPVADAVLLPGIGKYCKEYVQPVTPGSEAPLCYLNPWPGDGWFRDSPSAIRLRFAARADELQLCVVNAGSWVEAQAKPAWADFAPWTYESIPVMWSGWQNKRLPLLVPTDGGVVMRADLRQGQRQWMVGVAAQGPAMLERYRGKRMSVYTALPRLNAVKDMTLAWSGRAKNPCLMMGRQEMQRVGARERAAYAGATNVEQLRAQLDRLACLDLMRDPKPIAYRYDAVMGMAELSDADRALFKAQMAYLGYIEKSPLHWSFERGYNSGNPNMTVSRTCNIGLIGCAMLENPAGRAWARYAFDWMKYWLEHVVDEKGEWIESSHYARYAYSCITLFAIAARQAGVGDLLAHPKYRRMVEFYEKTLTPPDPLRLVNNPRLGRLDSYGVRVDPPYGRGTRGDAWELGGLVARALATAVPELSRRLQWSWRESGCVEWFAGKTAGQAPLYVNRNLPARAPDWRSERFPHLGYLLRSGVGTPRENYLLFVSEYYRSADGEIWPSNTGAIVKWFAGGTPMGGAFVRMYKQSHVLLENRVMLACNWDPAAGEKPPSSGYVTRSSHDAFARQPTLDYVNVRFETPAIGEHPIRLDPKAPAFPVREVVGACPLIWRRQLLLTKPGVVGGPDYLLLRDTVACEQPTQWHFWTLSKRLITPAEAGQTVNGGDASPAETRNARRLKGDRFIAVGQFDKDLDYYIASPPDTPRYTARYGSHQSGYGLRQFDEYQDLLHLQLPGAGTYFVCLFARPSGRPAPRFTTVADGAGMVVAGDFGRDTCFLSTHRVDARVKETGVVFSGTAGAVHDRASGLRLTLAAGGEIGCRDYGVAAAHPVTLTVRPYTLVVESGADAYPGGALTITAPGKWRVVDPAPGVTAKRRRGHVVLALPAGCGRVVLRR